MGIPAYFAYIVKNHTKVLKSMFAMRGTVFHNLYLDSNSIIYDAFHEIYKTDPANSASYEHILALICSKIQAYIDQINPSNVIYIAFDGNAPPAKWAQQQKRRYLKTYLEENGCAEITTGISTNIITPGTDFMLFLSKYVENYGFVSRAKIIISTPMIDGEGEHKIFQYIRENRDVHKGQNTIVYGLDADLLMLSMLHIELTNLYVYRETPEFVKSLNIELDNGVGYFLDIHELCESLFKEMNMETDGVSCTKMSRVHDYVCLCFFLGNDFLPRIPTLNIRKDGIQVLMNAYRACVVRGRLVDIWNGAYIWENVNKVISWIAEREEGILLRHKKMDERKEFRLGENVERYVSVGEEGWRERYEKVCGERKEYKEGMLWVLKYYMGEEVLEWKWKGEMGKLMKEIEEERDVEEVKERKEEEILEEKKERRKGWKKYIWE